MLENVGNVPTILYGILKSHTIHKTNKIFTPSFCIEIEKVPVQPPRMMVVEDWMEKGILTDEGGRWMSVFELCRQKLYNPAALQQKGTTLKLLYNNMSTAESGDIS